MKKHQCPAILNPVAFLILKLSMSFDGILLARGSYLSSSDTRGGGENSVSNLRRVREM